MANMLLSLKERYPFLSDVPSQALQQRLKDLAQAVKEAYDLGNPKQWPKFKKKFKANESFRYPQGFKINNDVLYLPKIGYIPFFKSRDIQGKPKNCTISLECGRWYVSIQTEQTVPDPVHPSNSAVGGDRGVNKALALSNGKIYQVFTDGYEETQRTLESLRRNLEKLDEVSEEYICTKMDIDMLKDMLGKTLTERIKKVQRRLARIVKRSNNWKKQKQKIAKLHKKLADSRLDHVNKITNDVSKNHALVVLEELQVRNMTATAKGTKEEPGRNVKKKAGLNRAILNQGWYELERQLEYKEIWLGGNVMYVQPSFSSQTCSTCGHISPDNRPSQELFYCVKCGHTENADINAAKVVKSRGGQSRVACGLNGVAKPSEAGISFLEV